MVVLKFSRGVLVQSIESILVKPTYLFSSLLVLGCRNPKRLIANSGCDENNLDFM